jgi:hypothetical protein
VGLLRRIARARLASQVIRRLRRSGVTDAKYHTRTFTVRFTPRDGSVPTVLPLDTLVIDRKQRRRRQIEKFVAGYLETGGLPRDWQQARPMLRPVLRGGVPMTGIGAPLRRPALPFLHEFVVVDQPDTMTYVAADQLAEWGVTADEVFLAACGNLSGAVLRSVATEPTVVQFMDDGDAYWTSHLLLDGWLAGLAEQVGGVPVAFAPERGTLIVAADGSAHLPDLFRQAELAYLTSPRAITPMGYVSDERGHTVPYQAPPGHPMRGCVLRAEAVQAMHEYARQAETLKNAAPLELVDGGRTRTVWHEGVLLPQADEVRIGDEIQPWAEVEPRLTRVADLEPPRWRTSQDPS